ncbi:MAG: T9SS type A sorting domain-containing protein [Candidatus Cloacimonetes bacterium]|nr:T9SS type A sorting domain-containing protein [Candidatus Cloacimonadota bacterium]
MNKTLVILLFGLSAILGAFEVFPFALEIEGIHHANLQQSPLVLGNTVGDQCFLQLDTGSGWVQYNTYMKSLPITGSCLRNANTLMLAMGGGYWSDGVYNFDLNNHSWQLNEWFYWPKFLLKYPGNNHFYVGDDTGLLHSADGISWDWIYSVGKEECNSLAWHGEHLITNIGDTVWYSADSGQSWQMSPMTLLRGFRFTDQGILYGLMNAGSDSDGLWRSQDFGMSWNVVFYTTGLCQIGPDYDGYLPLGWDQPNENSLFLQLKAPDDSLIPLSHPVLHYPVWDLEAFPLVNTPSFYVLNLAGIYFLTNITEANDPAVPPASLWEASLCPNPVNKFLELSFSGQIPPRAEISIFDLKGRKLASPGSLATQEGKLSLEIPALASGIYLLRIAADGHTRILRMAVIR